MILPIVAERFIKYARFDSQSKYISDTYPSTSKQLLLAQELASDMQKIGLKDVHVDEYGYACGTLPANVEGNIPIIGFLAHMDTTPEFTAENVNPQIVENYDGGDIVLNEDCVLSPLQSPELSNYIGQTLITTDGNTLLGVDDKAGVAEIITAMEYLINNNDIPHGTIKVAFTPDEEVGRGVKYFDINKFGVDYAYTLDGGPIGELNYETFNGALAKVTVNGRNVHPGLAKNKMINAIDILMELNSMLPINQKPQYTENKEGYFHALTIEGDVDKCIESFYIRDHDIDKFQSRKELIKNAVDYLKNKHGDNIIELVIEDQYYNMKYKLEDVMFIVDIMEKAAKEVGIKPYYKAFRGGTDGAWLTHEGLPTPNIFIGGHNYHGKYEYVPVYSMEKAVEVVAKIAELYTYRENYSHKKLTD
ncbi:MAG: peptidase T [Tissierellia bacterium]|nr:peptidase T [Tissierellia bacterium]